ncbi:hypothetical protein MAPG_10704 [Magnaporthiopsis poae ATCC 64411]|uniref:Uncharacterized protein n=1 Tax=Magnaporthiopsis poae (strain ATCC 64411 / 73-15) TaxID=644358 RepID=A0A0C4EDA9_MAGP6|nr:hypothetical protein MAPG_10704 [Magnaporthiopsis poae ATCC 64411]
MVFTVSLNGPDNVGKTTQLELLPAHFTISKLGGLHDSDETIAELHRQGRLKEWWWGSTPVEFVSTIFGALARRHRNATGKQGDVVVLDRGIDMFEAVAVAVIAMKDEDGDLANARRILDGILDKHGLRLPPENLAVLIKHGKTLDESVRITMSRESSPDDERYNRYQRLLQSELRRQELAGAYQHTIHVTATDSIGCVQDRLRKILLEKTANPLFQPTMHHLVGIYAFGGLSECGKSTIAEAFCAIFGTKQAFRAKIAYFNDTASEALGLSVYDMSEKEQALYLFHELDRFQRSHYWLRLLTIESLHRDSVTKHLKLWLGEKFQVVFIDTCESQRRERSLISCWIIMDHFQSPSLH